MRLANRFSVNSKIGSGGFSKVYSAKDLKTGQDVAVKIDISSIKTGSKKALVLYEADVLTHLHRDGTVRGIPKIHWSGYVPLKEKVGESSQVSAVVMDRLGDDLEKVLQKRKYFKSHEVAQLSTRLLSIIESIHKRGILHRDLKPANIMLGYSDLDIYIADFGLSKRYLNDAGEHIPFCDNKRGLTGTPRYCSTYSHYGVESSRRDDLQSWLFVTVYMFKGKLPWQGLSSAKKTESKKHVAKVKMDQLFSGSLCEGCPEQLRKIAKYIKELSFEETPDYDYLKKILKELIK